MCDTTSNGIAQCRCLDDFVPDGNTIKGCIKIPHNPCSPNPCGTNAECRTSTRDKRPVCTCPIGYEGDPLTNCTRGDCIEASDCPAHLTCQKLRCINPCNIPNICGRRAECQTRDHQPICSCGLLLEGDPFIECRNFGKLELCRPSPCGINTNCKVRNDRAVCYCIDNYIGDPLTGCRPEWVSDILECVSDYECPSIMTCSNNRCMYPCIGGFISNGGNPLISCERGECKRHEDCRDNQTCYDYICQNPCSTELSVCGDSAECTVKNHQPACSCPPGYDGHPLQSCRPRNG